MLLRLASIAVAFCLALSCTTTTVVVDDRPPPPEPLFHDDLAPYGDWWWHDAYGWVWSPTVGMGWRPYTHGHWVWTDDAGWLWVSHEPFGSIAFHYGRWAWLDDAGWVWIPGHVWGPGWVVWRTGPGMIGWAPLSPHAVWVPGRGFVVTDVTVGITPWGWVFIEERSFAEPDVVVVVLPRSRNDEMIAHTHVRHRPEHEDGRVVNRGVASEDVERVTGKPIKRSTTAAERVERRPAIEQQHEREATDPARARGRTPQGEEADVRPLRDSDDDIERRYEDERKRALERHDAERRSPPAGVAPGDLPRRHDEELSRIEKEKQRDKATKEKKKATPRKMPKKKPAR